MWSLRNACVGCKRKHNGHLNWNRLAYVRLECDTFVIGDIVSWACASACDTDGIDCSICTVELSLDKFAVNSWPFCIIIAHRIWSLILVLYWLVWDDGGVAIRLLDDSESKSLEINSTAAPTWKERKIKIKIRKRMEIF